MDLYFLRRFLDKDYITNGIVYSGALHSADYINILVNLFNFKITHTAYAVTNNIVELNDIVKSYDPFSEKNKSLEYTAILFGTEDLFLPFGYKSIQCSDIAKFPPNFK